MTTQPVAQLQTSEQVMKSLRMSVFPPIQRKKEAHDRELFVLFLCKSCIDEHHQFKAHSLTPKFQERLNENGVVEQQLGEKRLRISTCSKEKNTRAAVSQFKVGGIGWSSSVKY